MAANKSNAELVKDIKKLRHELATLPILRQTNDKFNRRIQYHYIYIHDRLKVNGKL